MCNSSTIKILFCLFQTLRAGQVEATELTSRVGRNISSCKPIGSASVVALYSNNIITRLLMA